MVVQMVEQPMALPHRPADRHFAAHHLEGAGLIVRRIEGTKRPCRLASAGITEIDQWLAMMRDAFAANYNRLDQVLAAMNPKERKEKL